MPRFPSTQAEFENEVAALFAHANFQVERDFALAGNRIDIFAQKDKRRIAVECKRYESLVGYNTASAFAHLAELLRGRDLIDAAMLVTNRGFTPVAREIGARFSVQMFTIEELFREFGLPEDIAVPVFHPPPTERPSESRAYIFVVMPFSAEFEDVYLLGIRHVAETISAYAERADDIEHNEGIMEVVLHSIRRCDILIADTSTSNPNVMYELGLAHGVGTEVVIIHRENSSQLPIDLQGRNCIIYRNVVDLREKLAKRLKTTLQTTTKQKR